MDAGSIVGLLADDDRRKCFAALELGATTCDAVAAAADLSVERAAKALGRLVAGGLVVAGDGGGLYVLDAAFQLAAREALHRDAPDEHSDQPDDVRKVLRNFVTDGRITQIPA